MMFNWLSLIAGICYVALGIVMMVYKFLEPIYAYALGAVLILYGIFRIWRAISKFRNTAEDED
ncbi:C4-dicarboxylate ABC transporter [Chryseobacterium sp. Ch-15]|uniref:C4-dicarboxylate ABC transporter n=2 Tax=Chryseobacterium muglaense TaxID=2893752 RepID=A0A9Q3YSB3_9FLAO|nr:MULTISPECIES: DUF308 domain-containing protein [Chryseobacterium]MCC9035664.1 C4-dicarboxylate ABC transporter [Chryseobacterium muglaense]MCM2555154.1 C4-dicarboxylate ABC transporter [Chryseobacterium muglaense]